MRSQPLPGEEVVCLLDEATDNYLLLRLGWINGKRLYSVTLHLRLIESKIHIEQDWTDDCVEELMAARVAADDIILAFTEQEHHSLAELALA
jgi:hypothetical protein